MRVLKKDGGPERRTLTGMVVSTEVLSRIAAKWDTDQSGMFASPYANIIGQMCVDHFERYSNAPGRDITSLFEAWADDNADTETVEIVDRFLTSLSGSYAKLKKETNPELIIDQAAELFNRVKAQRTIAAAEGHLENGDTTKALAAFDKFRKVEMGAGQWIDPLRDEDAIRQAFEGKTEPIITYPGSLGRFFGSALERDGFIAIQAPDKTGKSYLLQDIAWTAMRQGRKVAFFEVGDLSQHQIMRRFMVRAARHPVKPCTLFIPKGITVDGKLSEVESDERVFTKSLVWGQAFEACQKVIARSKSDSSLLRLSVHPNSSISVNGIRAYLERWEKDGWMPDVVVCDYSDILAPVNGTSDTRDQINMTWKLLRRMSQELHCLVVTATQSNAGGYGADTQGRKNFSEDKRKLAHVTGMFGINQDNEEKKKGVCRLNWIVLREEAFVETDCCYIAGCLGIASPAICSWYKGE